MTYVSIPDSKQVKFNYIDYKCIFIENELNNKVFRFYDKFVKVIIKSNDIDFHKKGLLVKSRNNGGTRISHVPMMKRFE